MNEGQLETVTRAEADRLVGNRVTKNKFDTIGGIAFGAGGASLATLWTYVSNHVHKMTGRQLLDLQSFLNVPDWDYDKAVVAIFALAAVTGAHMVHQSIKSNRDMKRAYESDPVGYIREHFDRQLV